MFRATHGPGIRLKALPGGPVDPTDRFRWKLCFGHLENRRVRGEAGYAVASCRGGIRAPISQNRGKMIPMMNITQWPLRMDMRPRVNEQDEVEDAAENEEHLDSPLQVVGGRYVSP